MLTIYTIMVQLSDHTLCFVYQACILGQFQEIMKSTISTRLPEIAGPSSAGRMLAIMGDDQDALIPTSRQEKRGRSAIRPMREPYRPAWGRDREP